MTATQRDRFEHRSPYAIHDEAARGRRFPEPRGAEPLFETDRRRVLHSTAFRRLVQKTQVFVSHEGDHFRTRLTHTLEVASHARRIARRLRVNESLAEAIALAHDLGHPPFGHAGEKALAELMADHGGFEHNVQSFRVVDVLEHPYPAFRGLNLTFEVREGLVKHCTPYDRPEVSSGRDPALRELFDAGPMPPLEGQVANLADVIAYTLHDIEDGLMQTMLDGDALMSCRLWRETAEPILRLWPERPLPALRRPILDALADRLIDDAADATTAAISAAGVAEADAVRRHSSPLAVHSGPMQTQIEELHALLWDRVYRNYRVVRMDAKARRLIRQLFAAYVREPNLMPPRWAGRVGEQGPQRVACDYVAGMTDRFCRHECARLFDPESQEE